MAKKNEKRTARLLYVEHNKDAKEIAQLIGVSEVTLSKWVNAENWRDLRNAKLSIPAARIDNIKQIINDLSEQRIADSIALKEAESNADTEECKHIRIRIAQTDDAVSKWNKTLETVNKENQVTLSTYIAVMEMIFNSLKAYDQKLFYASLEFQEVHLNEISLKFK